MHFAFTEDQELLRATTRRFLERRHPVAAVRERLDASDLLDRDVWAEGAALGWTALCVPEEFGGGAVTNQPVVDLVALTEELGRELYPGPVLGTNVAAYVVARYGDADQCARYLPAIARGELVASWCPGDEPPAPAGEPTDGVGVRATPDGLVLDGATTLVHDALVADVLLVAATGPDGPTLVLVPARTDGITMRPMRALDVTRRLGAVRFDGVRVRHSEVIPDSKAAVVAAAQLATVIQSAEVVGAGEALFERTLRYVQDRVQFGRTIGSFQAIKHRLADLCIELEAARAAARYAALAFADDRDDRDEAVAVAGAYVRDAIAHLCGEALQLHGGIGFTWEHDVHLYLRRVKTEQARYGPSWWYRERLCTLAEQATAVDWTVD